MPSISYDGQSFVVDGRRIWLASGSVHYPRTPRALWRQRIRAAKQAGLNCIDTYVFWSLHEPRPAVFDFDGERDLRHFIQLIQEEGLYCILRPGPYICGEWDFGGLPPWLTKIEGIALRQGNGPFLEACARYLGAVMEQVKDLQITAAPSRRATAHRVGPIVLMQAENEWFCHNPEQGDAYLREIARYLRENGCTVPIIECNNLWQRVDGTLATWNANRDLIGHLRQLRLVQDNAPRLVTEYWPGWFDHWGGEHRNDFDAPLNSDRLAQILAAGAQYNVYMFHGGTNFGFNAGRSVGSPAAFVTTSYDYDAPLREAGGRGEKYMAVKRISTFASQFAQVFAHFDPVAAHAAVAPGQGEHPMSVIHQRGEQGQIVFMIKSADDKTTDAELLLSDGQTLPVPIGDDRVAWCAIAVNLAGVAELTCTNLRPWAFVEKQMLVLFGPAGAAGIVSINGAAFYVKVPTGHTPLVERHENLIVVVLNGEQVDAAYLAPQGLVVGADGLDEHDQPIPLTGWPTVITISPDGETQKASVSVARKPPAPPLEPWEHARVDDMVNGTSDKFKPIDGAASLEALGCNFGYGWYRLSVKKGKTNKTLAPWSGDRLHVYNDGQLAALLGHGPGAVYDSVRLRVGENTVVLADNLGRFCVGWQLGERKGLFGDVLAVRQARLTKPKVTPSPAPNAFALGGFFNGLTRGEQNPADTLSWKVKPAGRKPLILDIQGLPMRAMVMANNAPVGMYDPVMTAGLGRFVLDVGDKITGGQNDLQLALFEPYDGRTDVNKHVCVYQVTEIITSKAEWAFAPWEHPAADAFAPFERVKGQEPCWYRSQFTVTHTDVPLFLEPRGLSKGQIYVNGHNAGRYFLTTRTGKAVGPQKRYYLPEPWLHTDKPNELLLFDEHGKQPGKCRLVYDAMGPWG